MKILHLGDLHIGCTLAKHPRTEEHRRVFQFLTGLVQERQIEAVLLTGDIFDSSSATPEQHQLYYDFLNRLRLAGCKHLVVIAGNHDSAQFLAAPADLLAPLNIVVSAVPHPDQPAREVVLLGDRDNPRALVCAVPFLRENIAGNAKTGESAQTRRERYHAAVINHYQQVYREALARRGERKIPIIGMGHLWLEGAKLNSANQDYLGNLEQISSQGMPEFDYFALGHIHRPQEAGAANRVYAGAVLPMNLTDPRRMYVPRVIILDTDAPANYESIVIPGNCFDSMSTVKGDMEELRRELRQKAETAKSEGRSRIWVRPVYQSAELRPDWLVELQLEFKETPLILVNPERQETSPEQPCKETIPAPEEVAVQEEKPTPEQVYRDTMDVKITDPEQRRRLDEKFQQALKKAGDTAVPAAANGCNGKLQFLELYIKNLNSLYGEHRINFTSPDFANGIFLICGDTGAGKSTILDAICLALFAWTPRLGEISKKDVRVLSKGMNECAVELTFKLGNETYTACLNKRLTRGRRPDIQGRQRRLLHNGNIMPHKTDADVDKTIQNLLGMKPEQFTGCVLLAQGKFDELLKADADNRAELLRQITGTWEFSRIGSEINRQHNAVKQAWEVSSKSAGSITCLNDEERLQKEAEKNSAEAARTETRTRLEAAAEIERLLVQLETCRQEVLAAGTEAEAAAAAKEQETAERTMLAAALRAQCCRDAGEECRRLQEQNLALTRQREKLLTARSEQETAALQAKAADDAAARELTEKSAGDEAKSRLFAEVKTLDTQLNSLRQQLTQRETEQSGLRAGEERLKQEEEADFQTLQAHRNASQQAQRYLAAHPRDGELAAAEPLWQEQLKSLQETEQTAAGLQRDCTAGQNKITLAETRQQQSSQLVKDTENELAAAEAAREAANEKFTAAAAGKTREELAALVENAEKTLAFFREQENFEERRHSLQEGTPCPLCGSKEHPFCAGITHQVPAAEITLQNCRTALRQYEKTETALNSAENTCVRLQAILETRRQTLTDAAEHLTALRKEQESRQQQLTKLQQNSADKRTELAAAIRELLGIKWTGNQLPEELQQRQKAFADANAALHALAAAEQAYRERESGRQGRRRQTAAQQERLTAAIQSLTQEIEVKTQERTAKFGTEPVEPAEIQWRELLENLRQKARLCQLQAAESTAALKQTTESLEQNSAELAALATAGTAAAAQFQAVLAEQGLTEAEYRQMVLPADKLQNLQEQIRKTDDRSLRANAILAARQEKLLAAEAAVPPGTDLEENRKCLAEAQTQIQILEQQCTDLVALLLADDDKRRRYAGLQAELQEIEQEKNDWKVLDDFFGPSDGKRFNNLAQTYNFKALLRAANANRPTILREHFTLCCDPENPLELSVTDHLRNDVIRTARNLSGGECFEVSLALALGLADLTAGNQNAMLGNVLLDEGFGSLDARTLESQLDLLADLHRSNGKLVGIISHVEKLAEVIPARIEVSCVNGVGSLHGAGVTEVPVRRD